MADGDSKRPTYTVDAIPTDIKNGLFLGNPMMDNIVACLIGLSTEVWAGKRRMKVLEALLAKHGITPEMVEKYTPSAEETAAWEKERDAFVELSLGNLANDASHPFTAGFATHG